MNWGKIKKAAYYMLIGSAVVLLLIMGFLCEMEKYKTIRVHFPDLSLVEYIFVGDRIFVTPKY